MKTGFILVFDNKKIPEGRIKKIPSIKKQNISSK